MMCQRIGRPPISTIGFGLMLVSSAMRVPLPPARMTALTPWLGEHHARFLEMSADGRRRHAHRPGHRPLATGPGP